jgi:hypothetical protein
MARALTATTLGTSFAGGEPEWVLVKSLVISQARPGQVDSVTTTETFMDKRSIEAAGPYKKAGFRQSARDNTGYEVKFGRNQINWY